MDGPHTDPKAKLYKFGVSYPDQREWKYADVWADEETSDGGKRLVIAPSSNQIEVLIRLLHAMEEPFWLLYVLVVNRGTGEPGRYQSPEPVDQARAVEFLRDFQVFLQGDGRHNFWIASSEMRATLVYDRHNVIYAYGPLDACRLALTECGFVQQDSIRFPDPHSHHYHQSLDDEEKRLLARWDWHHTALRTQDNE